MSIEAELQRSMGADILDPAVAFTRHVVEGREPTKLDHLRIAVTGAQSTGITTVARNLSISLGIPLLSEVARAVFEHGFKPGVGGSMASQSTIWFTQYFMERQARSFVTDRFLLCGTAHAEVLAELSGEEADLTCATTMANATAMAMSDYTAVFYTPIEFALVSDGVRDEDTEFQSRLDAKVLELFDRYDLPYYPLRGTPEQRNATALEVLAELGVAVPAAREVV